MLVQPVIQPIICIGGGDHFFERCHSHYEEPTNVHVTNPAIGKARLFKGGGGGGADENRGGGGVDTRLTNEVTSKHLSVGRDP